MLGSLKFAAIAAGIASVVAFGAGWKTRDAFCDAAEARARVASLEKQITAYHTAAQQDAERVRAAEETKAKMEGVARELETKITAGVCMSGDDADRLRDLWK
jgi:hypothetical protein